MKCESCSATLLTAKSVNGGTQSQPRQWSAAVTDPLGATDADISEKAKKESASQHELIRELELELAQTKLALVESEVHNQVSLCY